MEYSLQKKGEYNILTLKGSLLADIQSKEILQLVSDELNNGISKYVIDLSELKFINSSGLGMMLTILTKVRKAGGDAVLANVPEQVQNLLIITKLQAIFKTADSVEEAATKFE